MKDKQSFSENEFLIFEKASGVPLIRLLP